MLVFRLLYSLLFVVFQIVSADRMVDKVLSLRDENGIIEVTTSNYQLVSRTGIEGFYSVLYITLRGTTTDGRTCEVCQDFEETYEYVVTNLRRQNPSMNVLFFIADTSTNPQLVQELKLQHVPHLLVYPPPTEESIKNYNWVKNQFYQYELTSEHAKNVMRLTEFFGKTMNTLLTIEEPFDVNEFATYFVVCIIIFVAFKKLVLPKIDNKPKFFCFLLIFGIMLPSLTGYKFTQIKGIPFIARNDKGEIMFFSGGTSWQFGIEILSMSLIYIWIGLEVVGLILVSKLEMVPPRRILVTSILACTLFYSTQYYMSVYLIKSPHYPFSF